MSDATPKLSLPFIVAAQAQKEVTHNEALTALDVLVQPAIEDRDLAAPPATPGEGQSWLVAATASGAWAGREGTLAQFVGGVWRFYSPFAGMAAWVKDEATTLRYDGTQWQARGPAVIGPAAAAIADPSGGTTVDAEARAALASALQALRDHGLIAV
ncbi:MAG: DUF2793 domain-containing protein [Alphaproteobacteria bacterium]|nr:MAG: DUF2793 domain-containing protein [Alphaproteobacteria bacterium]